MLRWRILLGSIIIAVLILSGYADWYLEKQTAISGLVLFPILISLLIPACSELIALSKLGGAKPIRLVVYLGTILVVTMSWVAPIISSWASEKLIHTDRMQPFLHATSGSWAFSGLGLALIFTFMAEIYRYKHPGASVMHVAATMFTILYLGLLSAFLVQIRLVGGIGYLIAFLLTVKMGDTGAYVIGRLFGRTKLAPNLSPGKTIEGAIGALIFSCLGSWAIFCQILPACSSTFGSHGVQGLEHGVPFDWLIFGFLIGFIGMIGDLAESMLKREAQQKDSSTWLPGFGGVLDILDSILLAAPAAYALWAFGIIVP